MYLIEICKVHSNTCSSCVSICNSTCYCMELSTGSPGSTYFTNCITLYLSDVLTSIMLRWLDAISDKWLHLEWMCGVSGSFGAIDIAQEKLQGWPQ